MSEEGANWQQITLAGQIKLKASLSALMTGCTRSFAMSLLEYVLVSLPGMCQSCMWDGRSHPQWRQVIPSVHSQNGQPFLADKSKFIYKSSEKSPLSALLVAKLVKEAGFPPGVIQFVSGPGKTGGLLASDMEIQKISFTGSTYTGKLVSKLALESNMKKVTLELGGKSAALVFADADIPNAVGS